MKSLFLLVVYLFIAPPINSQNIKWQQLNGPHGGTAISFASNTSGDIFAGADYIQNGVNRSTDGGFTWSMCSNGIHDIGYRSIDAIFVTGGNNILIGTNSPNGSRIYRSTNNGDTWYVVANDFGAKAFAADNNGVIYALQPSGGIHKSTDYGITWEQLSIPSNYSESMDIAINDSGHIFITGYNILRSTDNGITWEDIGSGYIAPGVGVTSIAINDSGHIFVGCTQEYASNSGILKSTDNGETWTQVKMGIRIGEHHNIVINSEGHIFAGSYGWGIWKSTDNGVNWTQYNSGLQHLYIRSMHISNGVLYAGTVEGGIYLSDDWAENWVQVGFNAAIVKKISISPANGNFFTAVSGVSRSTDSGQTWEPVNYGLTDYGTNSFAIKNDGTIFCCTKGTNLYYLPTVYRSTDNGNSWTVISTGLSQYYSKNAIIIDQQENLYVNDWDAVYKSTNNGDSWFSIGGPGESTDLAINSAGDLFAIKSQVIWCKPYGDTNWVQLPTPAPWLNKLFISSKDYIYSAQFRSTDNGVTWTQMNIATTPGCFTENSLNHLFAGTYGAVSNDGVYISKDYGDNWTQVNDGLTCTQILSLVIDSAGYVYAGTKGGSIFKTTTSTITSVTNLVECLPTSFVLEQNYPNPFNPSTKIKFTIPSNVILSEAKNLVTLKVFDVLGKEVVTLVNEYKPAGRYEVEFSVAQESIPAIASGVYFYQLKVVNPETSTGQSFIQTKKMILLR